MTDSTDNALKPCPFCGSSEIEDVMRTGYLQCQYCLASAKNRTAWNRRADLAPNSTDNARCSCLGSNEMCGCQNGPRADLAPDPLGAVKVKPLEWTFWSLGDNAGADAPSIVGLYQIRSRPKEGSHRLFLGSELIAEKDYTELKPFAQADYETRILSALEPCGPLADPRVVALVQRIEQYDFSCEAGPLRQCAEWLLLKEATKCV